MPLFKKILFEGNSTFNGKVQVVERLGVRRLIASDFTQSRSLDRFGNSEIYWDSFLDFTSSLSVNSSILILGLGAGTSAKMLRKKFPTSEITGIEIDPMIISLGKKYFDLDKINVEINIESAKDFVEQTQNKYDLVYLDVFIGAEAPSFVSEAIFFKKLQSILKPYGEIIVNSIYRKKAEADNYQDFFKQHFDLKDKVFSSKSYRLGNLIMKGVNYE